MKTIFPIIVSFVILLIFSGAVFSAEATISGISKIYIEYENGSYQEIDISPSINYTYFVQGSDFYQTDEDGAKVTLSTVTLNQNSNIKRIALYCASVTTPGGTIAINNYLGMTVNKPGAGSALQWFDGFSAPISSWASGTIDFDTEDSSGLTSGVFDFNGNIVQNNASTFTVSSGNGFDGRNKIINIRFKGVITGVFVGSENTTENL